MSGAAPRPATLWPALVGAAGGVAGALAMNGFARLVHRRGGREARGAAPGRWRAGRGVQPPQAEARAEDDATVRVGRVAAQLATGRDPAPRVERRLGTAVHLAFGAVAGAVYAVAAERWPAVAAGHGTVYGTVVWAVADEGMIPALGLSRAPAALPAPVHAYAIGGHWVYGAALETVRRLAARGLAG